ncbi:MAG: cell division protein SepF [Oscillospiraceae bacterium]
MGLVDKFKGMFVSLDEEYDNEVDFIQNQNSHKSEAPAPEMYEFEEEKSNKRGNKVVNIHATTQLQVILVKPEQFEDASGIADHLNAKRTVVLNLESANKELSRRLIDFLSGVAYANNGQIKRVANSTFIITPYNVDIMGDLIDELENNGVYF